MAAGDVHFFDQWLVDVAEKLHDHENDDFKYGIITSSTTPAETTADPRWGAGGTTNMTTNQVTPGGNYASGGPSIANPSCTLVSGQAIIDGDDIAIAQNASNPTNGRWAIIYNNTDTGKRCVGYVDLGGTIDFSAGAFSNAWNASGIAALNQA